MMDKIPIKTLLDHAKQPFIPYTTAKSVMWDGTDKTLYDVVMEGVPIPEIEKEYLPTYRVEDNSKDNPIVWSEQKKGIYFFPDWTLYYKMDANDSVRNTRILDYRVYKMYDYIGPEEDKPHFIYFGDTGIRRFNTHTLYNGGYVSDVLIPSKQAASWAIQGSTMFNYLPTCHQTPTQDAHLTTKKYVDNAITANNEGLNADIMVAINAASRAEAAAENVTTLRERFNTRPADANIAINPSGGLCKFLSTGSMTSNKPTDDGHILHMYWDTDAGWDSQLFVGNGPTPAVRVRGQNAGTWGSWITMAKQSDVDAKQKKITYGTGDPSGGSDGDVYLKYTA